MWLLLLALAVALAIPGWGRDAWVRAGLPAQFTIPTPTPKGEPGPLPTATPRRGGGGSQETPPTATPTPVQPVTVQAAPIAVPRRDMNIRQGPGTDYPIVGTALAGQAYPIIGRNAAGDWWQIRFDDDIGWLYAPLVDIQGDVAAVSVAQDVPEAPTPTATPAPLALPELDLSVRAEPPWAIPGEPLLFRVVVTNTGEVPAAEVLLSADVPAWLQVQDLQADAGSTALNGQTAEAMVEVLSPGARAQWLIAAVVADDAPLGAVIDLLVAADTAEGAHRSAGVSVPLPPAELPPTGGTACVLP